MTSEVMLPFAIDALGDVAHTESLAQQMANHIAMIIGTELYSRPMDPLYGVDTDAYLFDNNDPTSQSALIVDITTAIHDYEPLVDVQDVVLVPLDINEPTAMSVQVTFSIVTATSAAAPTAVYVATVTNSGAVLGLV